MQEKDVTGIMFIFMISFYAFAMFLATITLNTIILVDIDWNLWSVHHLPFMEVLNLGISWGTCD